MASRLDTDSSGAISKDEFIAGRPKGASAEQSGSLFDSLDSAKSGSMSLSDMSSAFQQMSSLMQATMLQAQEASSSTQATSSQGGHRHGPDATEMFAKLDSDGDGSVTKGEFLAGKPDDVTDEQASSLWNKIAGDNGGSLT